MIPILARVAVQFIEYLNDRFFYSLVSKLLHYLVVVIIIMENNQSGISVFYTIHMVVGLVVEMISHWVRGQNGEYF